MNLIDIYESFWNCDCLLILIYDCRKLVLSMSLSTYLVISLYKDTSVCKSLKLSEYFLKWFQFLCKKEKKGQQKLIYNTVLLRDCFIIYSWSYMMWNFFHCKSQILIKFVHHFTKLVTLMKYFCTWFFTLLVLNYQVTPFLFS